jgi:chromosome segregation ATPase
MAKTSRTGFEGDGMEPQDPNERLLQLQGELDQHNSRIDQLSKQRDLLQSDISGLSATVAEVKTTVTNYGANAKGLHDRLQALEYFYHQKSRMVQAAIGERKPLIDELTREYDEELARAEESLKELNDKQVAAQAESDEAAKVQATKQSEYDAANAYQATMTSKLTEMETLRANITQADESTDVATMYVLTQEFHARLKDTKIMSQNELAMELRLKLGELELAKEAARAKSAALAKAQAEYVAYKTTVDGKRTERQARLLKEVEARYPLPAEAELATTVAGTATVATAAAGATAAAAAAGATAGKK